MSEFGIEPKDLSVKRLVTFYKHCEKIHAKTEDIVKKGKMSIVMGMIREEFDSRGAISLDDIIDTGKIVVVEN